MTAEATTWTVVSITLIGAGAALCFSLEAILIKWLVLRGVDGAAGGYLVLFFDGLYGLVLLAILTAMGDGLYVVPGEDILPTLSGGVLTSLAIVLVNYGVANGVAGIAFSCANSFPAWHAIFNWAALG